MILFRRKKKRGSPRPKAKWKSDHDGFYWEKLEKRRNLNKGKKGKRRKNQPAKASAKNRALRRRQDKGKTDPLHDRETGGKRKKRGKKSRSILTQRELGKRVFGARKEDYVPTKKKRKKKVRSRPTIEERRMVSQRGKGARKKKKRRKAHQNHTGGACSKSEGGRSRTYNPQEKKKGGEKGKEWFASCRSWNRGGSAWPGDRGGEGKGLSFFCRRGRGGGGKKKESHQEINH